MIKFYEKLRKTLFWAHFEPFMPILEQTQECSLENPLPPIFPVSGFLWLHNCNQYLQTILKLCSSNHVTLRLKEKQVPQQTPRGFAHNSLELPE